MPAPLGKTPTRKMPKIQVLGLEDSRATRSAVRFFRERRIVVTFVDLGKRPLDAADLRAFMERLGPALLEPAAGAGPAGGGGGAAGAGGGAAPETTDRGALLARIRANPGLLRLPIVRHGTEITAGPSEATWKAWLARREG
jgi:arsenate reductase-like glutaredoxin family protein